SGVPVPLRRDRKVATPYTDASLASECGCRLSEKDALGFLRDRRLRVDFFCLGIGAHDCRPRLDALKPSLQVWEVLQFLSLAFVGNNPRVSRHVGDGVVAGDELAIGKALIEDAVEAVRLIDVSVDRIGDLCWRILAE